MYFNAYEEGPKFWSVDDGDTANEVKGTALHFVGCDFETVVNVGSKVQPRAWIQVPFASVWQSSDGAITIESAVKSVGLGATFGDAMEGLMAPAA
jgi:hypothetical protein